MAPFNLAPLADTVGYALIFLLIGVGFGAVLEMSGFGDTRKLAAQFYMRDMTVLKVMFTAIVVAAVLIFLASAFGLLDYSRVWVNPTYLVPGIVGGLIMGVGFIIGGFCPGTSLVAASTLKVDGMFFVLGVTFGIFLFGETVGWFEGFFNSTFYGRFTLADWLGLPYGVVVVALVLMALVMFWGAEIAEAYFGERKAWRDISLVPRSRGKVVAGGALLALALVVAIKGQPTIEDRYSWIAEEAEQQLRDRAVFVDPAEVVDLKKDFAVSVEILDLRSEAEFNLFHIAGARRIDPGDVRDPSFVRALLAVPDNTVTFLVSSVEDDAVRAWRDLRAQGVLNLYVIAGGIEGWLERYPPPSCVAERNPSGAMVWRYAVGDRIPAAHPFARWKDPPLPCAVATVGEPAHGEGVVTPGYVKKVKLQRKVAAKGGCG